MYLKISDFVNEWNEEAESTLKIFTQIPDSVKSVKDNENVRSLERLAWHITQTVTELPKSCGIMKDDALENRDIPSGFSEIIDLYKEHSRILSEAIEQKWNDEDLIKKMKVYGEEWEGRKILSILVKHQIHHRAQMTILMRLLDVKVPGLYGPAKEEWSQYGMEAQE